MSATSGLASSVLAAVRGARPPFALCYHGVGAAGPGGDPFGLMAPLPLFQAHLDLIEARGYETVHVSELWRRVAARDGHDGAGALTVDDGLADSMATIVSVLHGRGMTATAFIPTGLLGRRHPDLPDGARIVDRGQLLELANAGLEIGSHSVDHPDLRTLPYAAALDQLRRSRATLEDLLGRPVTTLAYPFGSFGNETMAAAKAAGYMVSCGCSGPAPWRAQALPREPVYPTTSPVRLGLKVAGLYGPAHAAARVRTRLRRARS